MELISKKKFFALKELHIFEVKVHLQNKKQFLW